MYCIQYCFLAINNKNSLKDSKIGLYVIKSQVFYLQ